MPAIVQAQDAPGSIARGGVRGRCWVMPLDSVDLETAKSARGTRLVVNAMVPSPWSEAAKGCFRVAGVSAFVVHRGFDSAAIDAWTGVDNVPVLLHEREPARTHWAAIVSAIDRMARGAGGSRLLPDAVSERARVMGLLHEIAGEEGIGWNARLTMIDAGLTGDGTQGFPPQVAKFLARRYGHASSDLSQVLERVAAQLAMIAEELVARGGQYFGGAHPNAIDVYSATFLTPVAEPLDDSNCPGVALPFRAAFAAAHGALASLVPATLLEHRTRMFAAHLQWPIAL